MFRLPDTTPHLRLDDPRIGPLDAEVIAELSAHSMDVEDSAIDLDLMMIPVIHLAELKVWRDKLVQEVDNYQSTHPHSHFLGVLTTLMQHTFLRLSMAMTWDEMTENIPEFQRFCLDITAWLNYVLEFSPRLVDPESVWTFRPVCHDLMGAVTEDTAILQQLHQMRIPVWRVVPAAKLRDNINILSIVNLSMPRDMDERPLYMPLRVLCVQVPGILMHQSMQRRGDIGPRSKDTSSSSSRFAPYPQPPPQVDDEILNPVPLGNAGMNNLASCSPGPTSEARSVGQIAAAVTNSHAPPPGPTQRINPASNAVGTVERCMQASTPRPQRSRCPVASESRVASSSGRDTFKDVYWEPMPSAIPAWAMPLTAVDCTLKPTSLVSLGYAVPDPNLFAASKSHRDEMLTMWLSRRETVYWFEISQNMFTGSRAPAQSWKAYLVKSLKPMEDQPSIMPKTRGTQAKNVVAQWFENAGLPLKEMPLNVSFGGTTFSSQGKLPHDVVTNVLWECFENNFCLELTRLDSHLMKDEWAQDTLRQVREELVRGVFFDPGDTTSDTLSETSGSDFIIKTQITRNMGLASPSWGP
ncbi:hypothetical protein DXG01_016287, partial [Tephrocybe rancida]